jgi:CRP/FNR family transcriptional regulator, nitrogen fixation regulation protein
MELGVGTCREGRPLATERVWDTPPLEQARTLVRCEVDEVVYHSEEQAQYWYRVVTGAARECSLMAGGRRQIVDFLLPGDVFGFGADNSHRFSAEVITTGTIIARYPRGVAEVLAESDPQVSRWIREKAFRSLSRLHARMLILGRTSALGRVSAFLLEWTDRCNQPAGTTINLPMSRYDIADYLMMAVETVSRALSSLRTRKIIAFGSTRRLSICDRRALELATEDSEDVLIAD